MTPCSWDFYRPLILAILDQAARDAGRKDEIGKEAQKWLFGEGMDWAEIAGITRWRVTNYERKSDTQTA